MVFKLREIIVCFVWVFREYSMEREKLMMQERVTGETALSKHEMLGSGAQGERQCIHRGKHGGYLKQTLVGR